MRRNMANRIKRKPPIEELKKYNAYRESDTAFQAHARLLQSKWRTWKGYAMGKFKGEDIGNRIDTSLGEKGVNFLTTNISKVVDKALQLGSKDHAMIMMDRLRSNLLSSQPLCFNLFGEMSFNSDLATQFFQEIFPEEVAEVSSVVYEYSTRRGKPDYSAFDVYVEYTSLTGHDKFFGIEVKYSENMREESKEKALRTLNKHRAEYTQLTKKSGYFKSGVIGEISLPPYSQLWRDHMLCYNMSTDEKLNREGNFIVLYPFNNGSCDRVVRNYQNKYLINNNSEESHFIVCDLNDFILTLDSLVNSKWTKELIDRYIVVEIDNQQE